jgi:glycosyltransferase involved in cell wall biosynthesis
VITSTFPRWEGDSATPFVYDLTKSLEKFGWESTVVAPHAPGARTRDEFDGISVRRFRYLVPERAETVCYDGGALLKLRQKPRELAKVPPLIAMQWLEALRAIRATDFDIVHTHWLLPQSFVANLLPGRPPHVATVHGGDIFGLRGSAIGRVKRWTVRHADAVTVNSSASRAAVLAVAPGLDSIVDIPMGIETDLVTDDRRVAEIRSRYRRRDGPLVGFLGRVLEEKGVIDLIDAAHRLRDRLPELTVVVAGDGPHREAAERATRERDLDDRVHFAGWVASDDVPNYLAAFDIFAAPSKTAPDGWIEAQGLSVIEAMAVGTPVIASRHGGLVDTVDDGVSGLLVPENDPVALADAIERIHGDPALAQRLVPAARERAVTKFSRGASASAFDALFRELIERRERSR